MTDVMSEKASLCLLVSLLSRQAVRRLAVERNDGQWEGNLYYSISSDCEVFDGLSGVLEQISQTHWQGYLGEPWNRPSTWYCDGSSHDPGCVPTLEHRPDGRRSVQLSRLHRAPRERLLFPPHARVERRMA